MNERTQHMAWGRRGAGNSLGASSAPPAAAGCCRRAAAGALTLRMSELSTALPGTAAGVRGGGERAASSERCWRHAALAL